MFWWACRNDDRANEGVHVGLAQDRRLAFVEDELAGGQVGETGHLADNASPRPEGTVTGPEPRGRHRRRCRSLAGSA